MGRRILGCPTCRAASDRAHSPNKRWYRLGVMRQTIRRMSNLLHMAVVLRPSPDETAETQVGPVHGATEERILSAALGLVGRRGVKRLGMQEVSEAAGVSRGTLYRYFPSKDHLLDAVAAYDEGRFAIGLAEVLAPVTEPAERIHTLVAFAFATKAASASLKSRFCRSPFISAYGSSPTTTTTASAPLTSLPSAEYVTVVPAETAPLIAASSVVPPGVTLPLRPCQSIVQPPHCIPKSSAASPTTTRSFNCFDNGKV